MFVHCESKSSKSQKKMSSLKLHIFRTGMIPRFQNMFCLNPTMASERDKCTFVFRSVGSPGPSRGGQNKKSHIKKCSGGHFCIIQNHFHAPGIHI